METCESQSNNTGTEQTKFFAVRSAMSEEQTLASVPTHWGASRTPRCTRQLGKGQISYVSFSVKIGHYKSAQTVEKYMMLCI